ncbi:MAG: hypothetical protein M3419_06425 [Actinomycetota bacterium]|nr:hypothetical protein [Actinomycetota bacterium]
MPLLTLGLAAWVPPLQAYLHTRAKQHLALAAAYALAARRRRQDARMLVASDPALARELVGGFSSVAEVGAVAELDQRLLDRDADRLVVIC